MTALYPEIEPYDHGLLDVGDGNRVYWETCGNPRGKPALFLHGGPGSGCTQRQRRLFDPDAYRIMLFDQRGCGRSTPHAGKPETDLSTNTTAHLIADIELLRRRLDIERWLLLGGSWGSTLALAYAEQYPDRVTEIILWGVTTGRHSEFDWVFRGGMAAFFPQEWDRLRDAIPAAERGRDIVEVYHELLHAPDPEVRQRAAYEWCLWESASPEWPPVPGLAPRFRDPAYAMAFARIVTHYVRHNGFLEDQSLLRNAGALAGIPGVLVNGRFDFGGSVGNAWELHRVWPGAEFVVVENAGHSAANTDIIQELVRATDGFRHTHR
jgi:proline iminopeptidase